MSKTADDLRSKGIYNLNQFAVGQIVILFRPAFKSGAAWQVKRIEAPNAEGFGGNDTVLATFNVSGKADRSVKLTEAKAWAGQEFGIVRWAIEPFCGGYMDSSVLRRRLAEIS